MPSFSDSIFLFVLALLLFGPKKLPVLARELGKWVGEFRRASNEFRMQMEEELRVSEQEERQKRVEAMEAAAPAAPVIEEPEHPHLPHPSVGVSSDTPEDDTLSPKAEPIATSGELNMMPPATGLPVRRDLYPDLHHNAADERSATDSGSHHGVELPDESSRESVTHAG